MYMYRKRMIKCVAKMLQIGESFIKTIQEFSVYLCNVKLFPNKSLKNYEVM